MPNHITNKLTIIGTDEQVQEVLTFIQIEKKPDDSEPFGPGTIDFNKITPMPKWVFRGNLGREDEKKYGEENCWYEWCRKNWGTKWNAYGQPDKRNTGNTIFFETAWRGVPELILKLGFLFPEVEFEYGWADEDFGHNVAKIKFKDTGILEEYRPEGGSKEAYELAFEITQTTAADYDLAFNEEIGNYEYQEE